jgi:hypothetical protein
MARRDKGAYQLTPRDFALLRIIGLQYVVRLDQFQVLMTRYSEYVFDPGALIGYSTMMDRLSKLREAGYIKYDRILAHGPGWIWLTHKGLHAVDLDGYSAKLPAWRDLPHLFAINQVRLYTNWAYWESERSLRQSKRRGPYPDALMWETEEDHEQGKVIAIEAEISSKQTWMRERKLKDLMDIFYGYDRVRMYVPSGKLYEKMEAARKKVGYRSDRIEIIYEPRIDPGLPAYA